MNDPDYIRVYFASEWGGALREAEYDAKVTPKQVTLVRLIDGSHAAAGFRTRLQGHVARSRDEALTAFRNSQHQRAVALENEARRVLALANEADARLRELP